MATRENLIMLINNVPQRIIYEVLKHEMWNYSVNIPLSHVLVSHLAYNAGLHNKQVPFTVSCDAGANWFRDRRQYRLGQAYGGTYKPEVGDVIYFSSTHRQADATHVGYVKNFDGSIITILSMKECKLTEDSYYIDNPYIIGFGVPFFDDIYEFGTKAKCIGIVDCNMCVKLIPNDTSTKVGMLYKGQSVSMVDVVENGWFKIVWKISKTGYGYIKPDCVLLKVVEPYQQYYGPKVGDTMWSNAIRYFKYPSTSKGRPKVCKPGLVTIEEVSPKMCKVSSKDKKANKFNGWIDKSFVDIPCDLGYNNLRGEVTASVLNVRVGPGAVFTKVQEWPQLVSGNVVTITGVDEDTDGTKWYTIWFEGIAGCVNGKYIKEV